MNQTKRHARILAAAFDEVRYFPAVTRPVDVTDIKAFSEMELARQHLERMRSQEREA